MLKRFTQISLISCVLLLVTAAAVPSPQEEKEKAPKDQQEYELINAAFKESSPAKRLQLLDQWKEKYPETDYQEERTRAYMASYQATGQNEKAIETAQKILEAHPRDFAAHYTVTSLTMAIGGDNPEIQRAGKSSAEAILSGGVNKPAKLQESQWQQAKQQAELAAHQTLGWLAMQQKDNQTAEKHFVEVLKRNPKAGQVSFWLGRSVLAQGNPDKNELALFSIARAAAYDGEGSLTAQGRQQVDAYLTKVYTKYTGTEEGLEDLKAMAKEQALPPPDLEIESASVRAFKAEQQSRKENPLLWVFQDLKANLTGPQGDSVWSDLNGKLTPKMRLYVVSASPPSRPTRLNLSSERGGPVEVVLNLENRLRTGVRSGRAVTFEGVAASLRKDPFRLTLNDGNIL